MILSPAQVLELVKSPIDPVISENKKLQDDHKVHIQGTGFKEILHQIIGYENVEDLKRKKILTQPFTRPLFKKIINAQSRWKTSWGTSKFYHFKNNSQGLSKEFKEKVLSQVWKGLSIGEFIKEFESKAIYEEFNGFYLVEKPRVEVIEGVRYSVRENIYTPLVDYENVKPYICFISVDDVYKFKVAGKRVEFLVLCFGEIKRGNNTIKLYRVIDDKYDYIVEKDGDNVKISEEYPKIEHNAGRCPASCITHINRSLTDDKTKTSPVDDIIKLLDYHLHQFAEHLVTEVLHAHPVYYQVGIKCMNVVEGTKCENGRIVYQKDGKDFDVECRACNGSGHNLKKDASNIIILPAKDEEGKAFNASNVAGYVTADVDILKYQQDSIDWMEEKILEAATGLNNFAQTEGLEKTATGVIANIKPLEDIISEIIDIIEGVETNLTDIIGKMYYGDSYISCEIIYGRKLSLRDENALLKEIKESKEAGTSQSHIKSLNEELTYSRFIRSNSDLQRNIILNELEPLIGWNYEEIEESKNIPKKTKQLKQNFTDLIQRFEIEHGNIILFMPGSELTKKIAAIKDILTEYIDGMDLGDDSDSGVEKTQNTIV